MLSGLNIFRIQIYKHFEHCILLVKLLLKLEITGLYLELKFFRQFKHVVHQGIKERCSFLTLIGN